MHQKLSNEYLDIVTSSTSVVSSKIPIHVQEVLLHLNKFPQISGQNHCYYLVTALINTS